MAMQNFRKRGRIPEELEFECLPIAKRINLLSIGHATSFEAEGSSSSDSQSPKSNGTSQPSNFLTNQVSTWSGNETDYAVQHAGQLLDVDPHHYTGHLLAQDSIQLDPTQYDPRRQNDSHPGRLGGNGIHSSFTTAAAAHSNTDDSVMDHSTFLSGFPGAQPTNELSMTPGEYLPGEYTYYYHVNALLFEMHQSRLSRKQ